MKNKWIALSLLLVLAMFGAFYIYSALREPRKISTPPPFEAKEPQFRHDGNLVVFRNANQQDTLTKLNIEIADDESEITTGLMFRKKMEADRGMLFIFPDVNMRSFWMRNTIIPLDIIFISEDKTIVTIQKNTTPFSEKSIPSSAPAKYVLEVNAGTSDYFGWKEGDTMDWIRF
ncbi:MAG: DUF192 domain-containing protein [Bacteroidota bacterium]|nr:DUF192 domain-containing protein [Bacteroidota bacterium]MDX5429861.1 DUF192 domain-containing protein [Bacteroidota bacterium]MDX5468640.1 DUF192 domain-containing protein [Bacteroidota bacterium]